MKILCISDAWLPQINGVVRTYQQVGEELRRTGHEFEVIGPGHFACTLPLPGYNEIRVAPFAGISLPRMINARQPDFIHIATEGPLGLAARRYCLKRKLPFTTCYHTRFPEYAGKRLRYISGFAESAVWRYLRWFHKPAHIVMAASPRLEQELRAHDFHNHFHRFVRGVDLGLFYPHPQTGARSVALYVGRVAIEKNIEAFLEAEWHGDKIVVGQGPELERLRAAYPDVTFTGAKSGPELGALYRGADVFAFPSRTDTFGIVMIEALASGLPVAAFPVTGPADIIDRPELGALHEDFGQALALALTAPGTRESRAAHVARTYTWPRAAEQFLDALKKSRCAEGGFILQ